MLTTEASAIETTTVEPGQQAATTSTTNIVPEQKTTSNLPQGAIDIASIMPTPQTTTTSAPQGQASLPTTGSTFDNFAAQYGVN